MSPNVTRCLTLFVFCAGELPDVFQTPEEFLRFFQAVPKFRSHVPVAHEQLADTKDLAFTFPYQVSADPTYLEMKEEIRKMVLPVHAAELERKFRPIRVCGAPGTVSSLPSWFWLTRCAVDQASAKQISASVESGLFWTQTSRL